MRHVAILGGISALKYFTVFPDKDMIWRMTTMVEKVIWYQFIKKLYNWKQFSSLSDDIPYWFKT